MAAGSVHPDPAAGTAVAVAAAAAGLDTVVPFKPLKG
jgi:hypothetical protein